MKDKRKLYFRVPLENFLLDMTANFKIGKVKKNI
jgi:hypothetical protein